MGGRRDTVRSAARRLRFYIRMSILMHIHMSSHMSLHMSAHISVYKSLEPHTNWAVRPCRSRASMVQILEV